MLQDMYQLYTIGLTINHSKWHCDYAIFLNMTMHKLNGPFLKKDKKLVPITWCRWPLFDSASPKWSTWYPFLTLGGQGLPNLFLTWSLKSIRVINLNMTSILFIVLNH